MAAHPCVHRLILEERVDRPDDDASILMLARVMMEKLGVDEGGHVLLKGAGFRQTVGVAHEARGLDRLKVRVSASARSNLRVRTGDRVTACAFHNLPTGECVQVAPIEGLSAGVVENFLDSYLIPHFRGASRPTSRGDTFLVRAGPRPVEFQVLAVSPGDSVLVSAETQILVDSTPIKREIEDKHAPASPRVPFSPMIAVTVRNLEGEELLDREDMLRSSTVTDVKERVKAKAFRRIVEGQEATRSRTFLAMGCAMKLIYHQRGMEDDENFESEEYAADVELQAVLFVRLHSAWCWGDKEAGGNSQWVKEDLSHSIAKVFRTSRAFAAMNNVGRVITWGDAVCGGDSSSVERQLSTNVITLYSNNWAFAALKKGGSLVTWGDRQSGGDSSAVTSQLASDIAMVYHTDVAFACVKNQGCVVTWGEPNFGGDSRAVSEQIASGVMALIPTDAAFAALKRDTGEVVAWGSPDAGGDTGTVSSQLKGVTEVRANCRAFAALRNDGTVFTWGDPAFCSGSEPLFTRRAASITCTVVDNVLYTASPMDISALYANRGAFVALGTNGQVVTWGSPQFGGDSTDHAEALSSGVAKIFCNHGAFAVVKHAGSVVTWGDPLRGGDCTRVAGNLASDVVSIESNSWAFAAVKINRGIVCWGEPQSGGDASDVAQHLVHSVKTLYHTERAFAALKDDGAVITWGEGMFGGDSRGVAEELSSGVTTVCASDGAFAALKQSGSVIAWGDHARGGDCFGVEVGIQREHIENISSGVTQLYSNGLAFIALRERGTYQC